MRRILLADDNDINRLIVARLLGRLGHHVLLAATGREALDVLAAEPIDVVFMDVRMPVMDGFEAVSRLRAAEAGTGRHTPVVAMTAQAMTGDRQRCLDAGMDEYLAKPVQRQDLERVLGGLADRARPPCFDPHDLLARFDGDRQLAAEIVRLFLTRRNVLLDRLRDAVADLDLATAAEAAHSFKGVAGYVSAVLAESAESLERCCRLGNAVGAKASLTSLQRDVATAEEQLLAFLGDEA